MVELHEDCPFILSEDIAAEGHTMGSLAVLSHLVELYHVTVEVGALARYSLIMPSPLSYHT